jgi:hypothetical protein
MFEVLGVTKEKFVKERTKVVDRKAVRRLSLLLIMNRSTDWELQVDPPPPNTSGNITVTRCYSVLLAVSHSPECQGADSAMNQ